MSGLEWFRSGGELGGGGQHREAVMVLRLEIMLICSSICAGW